MAVLVVLAAVFLIGGVSAGNEANYGATQLLPLDMATSSVDDTYACCKPQMFSVAARYLRRERNLNHKFKRVWDESVALYDQNWKNKTTPLRREQIVALYTYTSEEGKLYQDFNNAVRSQGLSYKVRFQFHALHFYLTTAIQALAGECVVGYRRTNVYFRKDVFNQQIRFGSFTSSSLGQYGSSAFGDKSCFEVTTCMGAKISKYSIFASENEVLIPPYEVFTVTNVRKKKNWPNLPCKVVYTLESTNKASSRLACGLVKKKNQCQVSHTVTKQDNSILNTAKVSLDSNF